MLLEQQIKQIFCRKNVQNNISEILWPSIIKTIHEEVKLESMFSKDRLKNKLVRLSEKQDKPLLDVSDNLNYIDVDRSMIP